MDKPIINLAEVPTRPGMEHGDRFGYSMKSVSTLIGARLLGYNVTTVPPGKRPFPFHNHRANEEMAFVLSGSGELRFGDQTWPIKPHDIMAFPPGGQEVAHQITNTGDEDLVFLCVSTKLDPEICQYPDSNKIGLMSGGFQDGWRELLRPQGLQYFDGE